MKALVYQGKGQIGMEERPEPQILDERDAIVEVTLTTICSSDIHIKHGAVPKAVPGTILGHEFTGRVIKTGSAVKKVRPGDRVAVNVETFCGECFYCRRGFVNNCTEKDGGWALGCRIDGGQAEYARIIAIDTDEYRLHLAKEKGLADLILVPGRDRIDEEIRTATEGRGADVVFEVAGGKDTFQTAWRIARPNAVVVIVAMYEEPQILPLPDMYGKNLVFKTGGVDGSFCQEIMDLTAAGKLDTDFLITHRCGMDQIMEAYDIFEHKKDHVIKFAIKPQNI